MSGLADRRVHELLDAIGAKTPAPGGGAVTGLVGAIAVALARMVVSYSVGPKTLGEHRPIIEAGAKELDAKRAILSGLADADAEAYERYSTLAEDDPGRPGAAFACVTVPLDVIEACASLVDTYDDLARVTNRRLRSDLAIAAILTEAVARASMCNVRVNLPLIEASGQSDHCRERGERGLARCAERLPQILEACA